MKTLYLPLFTMFILTLNSCEMDHKEEKNDQKVFRNKTKNENNEFSDTTINRPENGELKF